ncbi:hypothetical protein RHMOL_Rhmol06G0134600 [Rhododendron molle]|uniref:Uncharacterized protein n=1 Tax=Rhododendron molle TaxID=49168 RepID=A0ACC0NBY6_RHOML|nr:hypothetical protein RHMOL_Rhmol06G0134600 [Rhododendron molle]
MISHSTVRLLLCSYASNERYIFGPSPRNLLQTKTGLCIHKALELSKLRQVPTG